MMKMYEEMTDFEINRKVAVRSGGYAGKVNDSETKVKESDKSTNGLFYTERDYCNDPSDAWPIIMGNKIDIQHRDGFNTTCARNCSNMSAHKNPLRAAMIVFLMITEEEPSK
jgi:hypothetical protein